MFAYPVFSWVDVVADTALNSGIVWDFKKLNSDLRKCTFGFMNLVLFI